jgi:hypothetical protein
MQAYRIVSVTTYTTNVLILVFTNECALVYRLCGLVVRVPGYRSRGPGCDSPLYQIF